MPFFVIWGKDHLIDAGYENVTLQIDELALAYEGDEIGHGLVHHAPKDAQMNGWTGNCNLVIQQATESVCEHGCARAETIVIRLKFCVLNVRVV